MGRPMNEPPGYRIHPAYEAVTFPEMGWTLDEAQARARALAVVNSLVLYGIITDGEFVEGMYRVRAAPE